MGDRKTTAAGLVLLAVAFAVAYVNRHFFPHGSYVIVFVVLAWAGGTLVSRNLRSNWKPRPDIGPLQPGEIYETAVRLARMPNVPIAEIWRQRLHENGIESFYRGASPFGGRSAGVTNLNPGLPVVLWVGEHDLDRARQLFPELQDA